MKKWRKLLTGVLVGSMFVCTAVTSAQARTGKLIDPKTNAEVICRKNFEILDDVIKTTNYNRKCEFTLNKASRVRFNYVMSGCPRLRVTIKDAKTGKQVKSMVVTENTPDLYLLSGSYTMNIQVETRYAGYPILGNYSLSVFVKQVGDTFEENASHRNDTYETADEAPLLRYITGSFCQNEGTRYDIYRFESYYGSQDFTLSLDSNIYRPSDGAGLVYNVYTGYAYEQNQQGNYVDGEPAVSGEFKVPGIYSGSMGDETLGKVSFRVPIGICYLVLSTPEGADGRYEFSLQPEEVEYQDKEIYTTVGSVVDVVPDDFDRNYLDCMTYESFDKSIAAVQSDPGVILAASAGNTNVNGFGTYWANPRIQLKYQTRTYLHVEYTDVRRWTDNGYDPYYYYDVYWAAEKGITGGVKDQYGVASRFAPDGECTRGQMVAFMWRMVGCPEPVTEVNFKDVSKKAYYYKAVAWAQEEGITGGYTDNTFRPDNKCSRAQIVTFLYRLAGQPEVDYSDAYAFSDINYNDGKYYDAAVAWASWNGITGGYKDGTFRPENVCTRGQTVAFLHRAYNTIYKPNELTATWKF
ncbi:MAG: S-layer homology domain-containing protein [Lachnospiraceae bacterium]|nr:S-layer homology domain-containing protein [Lachnospiraceae bacterium]